MATKYAVKVVRTDPATGREMVPPVVSVMQGRFKVAKIYGENERRMRDIAEAICQALTSERIDIRSA